MEKLRGIIREAVIQEFSMLGVEERRVYDDIGGWSVYRPENHLISIFDTNGVEKGFLSKWRPSKEAGVRLYYDGENGNWKSYIKWEDFTNVKNAVRFVYLKRQEPISETLNEGNYDAWPKFVKQIEIPGIPGWTAERYESNATSANERGFDNWTIHSKRQDNRDSNWVKTIHQGTIYDNGLLTIENMLDIKNRSEINRKDLINNPIKAARYIWLKIQDQDADF